MAKKKEKKERPSKDELAMRWEVLLLWAILGEGAGKEVARTTLEEKGMLPSDDKAAREGLKRRGLITVEKRGRYRQFWLGVTDKGLAWAEDNLAAVPASSQKAAPVLQAWLRRLSLYMSAHDIPLTAILGMETGDSPQQDVAAGTPAAAAGTAPTPVNDAPAPASDYDAIRARVREAYLDVSDGQLNARVFLSDLRQRLRDIDHAALDGALCRMHLEQGTTLSGMNNPQEITPTIRDGSVTFKGEPMYALWITK